MLNGIVLGSVFSPARAIESDGPVVLIDDVETMQEVP